MKYIVCPDSFKESMSAVEVTQVIEKAILKFDPDAEVVKLPLSDGGEGFVQAIAIATEGTLQRVQVKDALMRPTVAEYLLIDNGQTAILELAQASGLEKIPMALRAPLKTSSFGTGEMILHALECGVDKIVIGLGGSATNDGGMGLLHALGVKFYDVRRRELTGCGENLEKIEQMDISNLDKRLKKVELIAATDVENRVLGVNGATYVYGRQKGATHEVCQRLEKGMLHFVSKVQEYCQVDISDAIGGGAAGGVGAVLIGILKAKRVSGIEWLLEKVNFQEVCKGAEWIVTGEGRIDAQTFQGKVVAGVLNTANDSSAQLILLAGLVSQEARHYEGERVKMVQITPEGECLESALKNGKANLSRAVESVLLEIKLK